MIGWAYYRPAQLLDFFFLNLLSGCKDNFNKYNKKCSCNTLPTFYNQDFTLSWCLKLFLFWLFWWGLWWEINVCHTVQNWIYLLKIGSDDGGEKWCSPSTEAVKDWTDFSFFRTRFHLHVCESTQPLHHCQDRRSLSSSVSMSSGICSSVHFHNLLQTWPIAAGSLCDWFAISKSF